MTSSTYLNTAYRTAGISFDACKAAYLPTGVLLEVLVPFRAPNKIHLEI